MNHNLTGKFASLPTKCSNKARARFIRSAAVVQRDPLLPVALRRSGSTDITVGEFHKIEAR